MVRWCLHCAVVRLVWMDLHPPCARTCRRRAPLFRRSPPRRCRPCTSWCSSPWSSRSPAADRRPSPGRATGGSPGTVRAGPRWCPAPCARGGSTWPGQGVRGRTGTLKHSPLIIRQVAWNEVHYKGSDLWNKTHYSEENLSKFRVSYPEWAMIGSILPRVSNDR